MEFKISTELARTMSDWEIADLLNQVYVDAGFTAPEEAAVIFEPSAVRKRGILFTAREGLSSRTAGMVILVPPDSPARHLAQENEAEIHLLGVFPEYRGQGLGRRLVSAVIHRAEQDGYSKLLLWTQPPMIAAQGLYESLGFVPIGEFQRNGRDFKLYEMSLVTSRP
jgi:ribosomal protein S18 acetylase RimI-like enzyme